MSRSDDHIHHLVDDLVHKLLTPDEARTVRRHCKRCPACKEALRSARRRLKDLRTVPPEAAPEKLITATLARIETHAPAWPQRLRRLAWIGGAAVAAALLLLIGLHVYYARLAPTPYDLQVLGQARLMAGSTAALRIRLIDRIRGTALAGVPIEMTLRGGGKSLKLGSLTTDAEGYGQPRFSVPDWNEDCELIVTARPGWTSETARHEVRVERAWKLMLSSDKPVYQPGQVIRLRSLTLSRFDSKPAANRPVTFSITDHQGNVIFKRKGESSRYGIASAECALADEVTEGAYVVQCQLDDTTSKRTVEVKRYVLPKFKVAVELDRKFYAPGQKLKATVHGDYFFGKPVAASSVEATLRDADGKQLAEQKKTSGADGRSEFEFVLPEGSAKNVTLTATITDSAGQKQSRSVVGVVSASAIRIEAYPENGRLVRGIANRVFVLTSYPDGRPAPTRLRTGPNGEQELRTSKLGLATLEVMSNQDTTNLTIEATDDEGVTSRTDVPLSTGPGGPDFLLRTDRSVLRAGETLTLTAFGDGTEPVFFYLLKDGQTILTATIPMADGRGEHRLELPAELSGTLQLYAYRAGTGGTATRKARVLFVRPAGDVDVRASLDRPEYRPARKSRLSLTLTDRQGKPVPGAVSLTAVDEAVFSVLGETPGMEKTFFSVEPELLRSVRERYPWSPDAPLGVEGKERDRFEEALFAATTITESAKSGQHSAVSFSPHTLALATFPQKEAEVEQTRHKGLIVVHAAYWILLWVMLAVAVLISYLAMWLYASKGIVAIVHLWLFLGLCLVLPSGVGRFFEFRSIDVIEDRAGGEWDYRTWIAGSGTPADLTNPDIGLNWEIGYFPPARGLAVHNFASARQDRLGRLIFAIDASESVISKLSAPGLRVREYFPETLLWQPELITDDQGRVSLDIDLADSITTWRLTASAVTADGRLGVTDRPLRVFQPFFVELNLPTHFTRGDEVTVPVVVYNYLDRPQTVELRLNDAAWFERLDEAGRKVDLTAGAVKSLSYRLRLRSVGRHELQVSGQGSGIADAIKRTIEVVPDGRRVDHVFNGTLQRPAEVALSVPGDAIEGSPKATLKLYPSSFSQLVEGLDAIFRMPSGCFEQASSTTYPNILALDYLRRTGKRMPAVEDKAHQYIHLGYQRLIGFEVPGGGFDWFGRPPANVTLTAYGLMEFRDMAQVHEVDPNLIVGSRSWLLRKRSADGSWAPESHGLQDDPTRGDDARLSTTAYVAWAVFDGDKPDADVRRTRTWLLQHRPDNISDPHALALVCNALLATGAVDEVKPYLDRLEQMKRTSEGGELVWWEQAAGRRTTFHGSGRSGSVETTSLAVLALLRSHHAPGDATRALGWLVRQKDANGTWHSTQATVLALKALLAGTVSDQEGERRVEIAWEGKSQTLVIPQDQAEVMQMVDLTPALASGAKRIRLSEGGNAAVGYQLSLRYHVPTNKTDADSPLSLEIAYDRKEVLVGEMVTATAKVANRTGEAPMVVLELPIPAGFAAVTEDFAKLVEKGTIAKFQAGSGSTLVYLRGVDAGKPLTLTYRLRSLMPVKVTAAAGRAYEYYDADRQAHSATAVLTVTPRP